MAEVADAAVPARTEDVSPSSDRVSLKRKASPSPEPEEDASKRARIDNGHPPDDQGDHGSDDHGRRSSLVDDDRDNSRRPPASKEEEKKRGRRLFGGLLSTLSQTTTTSTQQKRRREIEQRQQEKAQKQKVEDDKRMAERAARLNKVRRSEQINFDERVMKTRHSSLIARAHSLHTKAEPRIYYKPWKLTTVQEDAIDRQIADAKATVAREVEQFSRQREEHDQRHGRRRPSTSRGDRPSRRAEAESPAPPPEPASEPVPPVTQEEPAEITNGSSNHSSKGVADKDQHEEQGDVVVDNGEDMVMY